MKTTFFVLSALLMSNFAFAASEPLLKLDAASGFVPSHMRWSKQCRVFRDTVQLVTRKADAAPVSKSKRLRFSPEVRSVRDVATLIEAARRGKVVKETAPTDGNSYNYQGFQSNVSGPTRTVELKQYYSGYRHENASPAAKKLVKFLDLNCQ